MLHVRRGDYLALQNFHPVQSDEYYKKALELTKPENLLVFSDDIDWVKSNLLLDEASVFINHNKGNESYNDMRLMSLCKHHVIANSSFSWWGAYLNSHTKKIVLYPSVWFGEIVKHDTKDLCPPDWIKINYNC